MATVLAVTYESYKAGLITFSLEGLSDYSFGQIGRGNYCLSWSEIYRVEPYRYFGLRFLLVRFHSSDSPLLLPLFLINQTKLNLAILEQTRENNPLHIALTKKIDFAQVPWHSWVRKHKSDIYILESAYIKKIRYSLKKYCLLWLYLNVIFCASYVFVTDVSKIDQYYFLKIGIGFFWFTLMFTLGWYFGLRHSYIGIKEDEIELVIVSNKFHIPWSEITIVKYLNLFIIKELCVFSPISLYGMPYTSISLTFIDTAELKSVVIAETHPENPLHEAVVKYL